MQELGYDVDVRLPVGHLSPSERTGVAIARALQGWTGTSSVVVLDEPTAAMPGDEVQRLFEAVELTLPRRLLRNQHRRDARLAVRHDAPAHLVIEALP